MSFENDHCNFCNTSTGGKCRSQAIADHCNNRPVGNPFPSGYVNKHQELVNHPAYYGGEENLYEAIKVIEAWKLGFCLGNTVKYISRAGLKDKDKELEDLEKALWYLQRRVNQLRQLKNRLA